MEHQDYNAVLAILRPIMKTLPVLSNILEGSVEVVHAISVQVAAARRNKEDLRGLFKHAAAVQSQVILAVRNCSGEDQDALLKSVHQLVGLLIETKVFVAKTAGVSGAGVFKTMAHGTARFLTASSTAGKIADMKQRISDAAVIFGIAADIRTEQRIGEVHRVCGEIKTEQERLGREQREVNEHIRQDLQRAEEARDHYAQQQRKASERVEEERREEARRIQYHLKRAEEARERNAERQREAAEKVEYELKLHQESEERHANERSEIRERERLDEILKPAHTAAHYSGDAPEPCADGTRVSILSTIRDWVACENGPVVYWLAGLAGTGKTTIASSFCRQLETAGVKVLSFFISRNSPDRNKLAAVVTTLAHQLGQCSSAARSTISKALEKRPLISARPIADQTRELLVAPLAAIDQSADASPPQIVIVIDAMDECTDFADSDGRDLLQTLVPALCNQNFNVKLFLTSRYEPDLRVMLDQVFSGAQSDRETFLLHEVEEASVSADIRSFVTSGLASIRSRFPKIPRNWPPQEQIDELVTYSGKLFVFASTVLLWIGEKRASPISRLTEILSTTRLSRQVGPHERSPYSYLDALYLVVLQNATADPDPESETNSRLRLLLFLVTLVDYEVCPEILAGVLSLEKHDLDPLLGSLSSLLQLPNSSSTHPRIRLGLEAKSSRKLGISLDRQVRVFHKSFPDFIVDPRRCTDGRFLLSRIRDEPKLALAMLQAVQKLPLSLNADSDGNRSDSDEDDRDDVDDEPEKEPVFIAHVILRWHHHLLNTLTNPALDCAQALSLIQALRIKRTFKTLEIPRLRVKHLKAIRLLLAALVNALPGTTHYQFRQDVTSLADAPLISDTRKYGFILAEAHAVMAIIIHARIPQRQQTYDGMALPKRTIPKDAERHFRSLLQQLPSTIELPISGYYFSLREAAKSCTGDK
ncbi:hypothetical protein BKA62DRAFT_721026 [Auriculariales sp. MPI-PUGE-AT-0066]|nr:hypothetical protein BKA62DRAFT_721026 [Auriculariales sp. MPI-PUGE-AT-0066]